MWNATGDERGKSYKVYKDLAAEHASLQNKYNTVCDALVAKNETIRRLALELSELLGNPDQDGNALVNVKAAQRSFLEAVMLETRDPREGVKSVPEVRTESGTRAAVVVPNGLGVKKAV